MIELNEQTLLYSFLTNPKFRKWKHILLILALGVISSNLVFMAYRDCADVLGYRIYLLCLVAWISYLVVAYLNIYVLVPRLLLKMHYGWYIVIFSILIIVLPLYVMLLQEYLTRTVLDIPHRLESYTNPLIIVNNLSTFMIMAICFSASSITILLRHWMADMKRVSQLERDQIKSKVNQLKDQITPNFLSNILNHTSVLVKTEPLKASDMLLRLGQLLRYQLYDCSRREVLLSSEVNFLTNYLDLEQLYSDRFEYKISTKGDINRVFISPLLFMPFVQYAINNDEAISLDFTVENKEVYFVCKMSDRKRAPESDFYVIKQRLQLLYRNNFTLRTTDTTIELRLSI